MKELKLNDYEVEELDSSEMKNIDGGGDDEREEPTFVFPNVKHMK